MSHRFSLRQQIGHEVRKARKAEGLSQVELAEKLGYRSNSAISRLERGQEFLPPSAMEKLYNILSLTEGWLAATRIAQGIDHLPREALRELFSVARSSFSSIDYAKALGLLSTISGSIYQIASKIGWDRDLRKMDIEALILLGALYRIRNERIMAGNMYLKALDHAEILNDSYQVARALRDLGVVHRMEADILVAQGKSGKRARTQAASCFERALKTLEGYLQMRRDLKDWESIDSRSNLIVVHAGLGDLERASELFRSASSLVNQYCCDKDISSDWDMWMPQVIRKHYGKALLQTGNYAEAESILLEAVSITKSSQDPFYKLSQISAEIDLCMLYLSQGQVNKALEFKTHVIETVNQHGLLHQKERLRGVLCSFNEVLSPNDLLVE